MLEVVLAAAIPVAAAAGFLAGRRVRTRMALETLLRVQEEREARLEAERELERARTRDG
jgi:hypothetical protein